MKTQNLDLHEVANATEVCRCGVKHIPGQMTIQTVKAPEGTYYVVVDHNGNFYAKTHSSVDAKLIASAPELLSLMKKAVKLRVDDHVGGQILTDMEALIAKAEGK